MLVAAALIFGSALPLQIGARSHRVTEAEESPGNGAYGYSFNAFLMPAWLATGLADAEFPMQPKLRRLWTRAP